MGSTMTDDIKKPDTPLTEIALRVLHETHKRTGGDPRTTLVVLMTAASMSGHIIERSNKEMHEIYDKVDPVALAKLMHVTEQKH